jgi:hypothetical protein
MIALVAKKPVTYAGRKYQPGQSFQVRSRDDSKALTALGLAEYDRQDQSPAPVVAQPEPERALPEPTPDPEPHPEDTPDPTPLPEPVFSEVRQADIGETETVTPEPVEAETTKPKRVYKRRDMQAEQS